VAGGAPVAAATLPQPPTAAAKTRLAAQFRTAVPEAKARFPAADFATIQDGKLQLKRDDTVMVPPSATAVQKMIDARLPLIRIEQLLMDVDRLTQFRRPGTPVQGHQARPPQFSRTLRAALLAQATTLGVVSMSASGQGLPVDRLRRVLRDSLREETLTAAHAAIVNRHHTLPWSAVHGTGTLSSSDAQRFDIRASSRLASDSPRYYGDDEPAIGLDTHGADHDAVVSTQGVPLEGVRGVVPDGLAGEDLRLGRREACKQSTCVLSIACLEEAFPPQAREGGPALHRAAPPHNHQRILRQNLGEPWGPGPVHVRALSPLAGASSTSMEPPALVHHA
jgi:hypothetical protein